MIHFHNNTTSTPIHHGGNIEAAIQEYGFDRHHWLDLSTGISPWCWPVKDLSNHVWNALPPPTNELLKTASEYYSVDREKIIATPGSQLAIRLLPQLFEPSSVAIPQLGYQEHAASWQLAGHQIIHYRNTTELFEILESQRAEHVVVINPNNPSGDKIHTHTIDKIAANTPGLLLIDEAFIDLYDTLSSEPSQNSPNDPKIVSAVKNLANNMIILRSMGKFFGLAGLRLGFAIGDHPKLAMLNRLLQPWSISHSSIVIGSQALSDSLWQQQQCQRIKDQSNAFLPILTNLIKTTLTDLDQDYKIKSCGLFHTILIENAHGSTVLKKLHQTLAKQAIWTRLYNYNDNPAWLRFSLPKDIHQFKQQLEGN